MEEMIVVNYDNKVALVTNKEAKDIEKFEKRIFLFRSLAVILLITLISFFISFGLIKCVFVAEIPTLIWMSTVANILAMFMSALGVTWNENKLMEVCSVIEERQDKYI